MKLRLRGMTPTQIALVMGMTRNAIIGKMDRLGMTRKRKDRPIKVTPDHTVARPPSPPRRFSWEQRA